MISLPLAAPLQPPSFAVRKRQFVRALCDSTTGNAPSGLAARYFSLAQQDAAFGTSAMIADRYRFVTPEELRSALEQFCTDIGENDPASVAQMTRYRVFATSLQDFWSKREEFFAPNPARDATGDAAAAFMAAQSFASLFEHNSKAGGTPIAVPLVDRVMRRGARGLFDLGRVQFAELAQICVDLCDWLTRSGKSEVTLVEAPLGNTVPIAVLREVAQARGIRVTVVEWGCPRNDRALNGRTVRESAEDLASMPVMKAAKFILFIDDAITGSRFNKMARALRNAVGESRFGAVAIWVRFHPKAGRGTGQIRDLRRVRDWAKHHGMPFGEIKLSDLPLFSIDGGTPVFFQSALAWGDAAHTAGKRKANILFLFIDRLKAITRELGAPGNSPARATLIREVWRLDVNGNQSLISAVIAETVSVRLIEALPADFFDQIRDAAKTAFPHDYLGRAIAGEPDLRKRTDWLGRCIYDAASRYMADHEAVWLNRAVNDLHNAGYAAGVDSPHRDHDYGLYTLPMAKGEDALHLELVDLVVSAAKQLAPRPSP